MKQERLRILGVLVLTAMVSSFAAIPAGAQAKPVPGKLAGVVRDAAGTPQMGASVELVSEAVGVAASHGLLTNTQGMFRGEKLAPGFYTIRVTLAGFLPTLEKHIRVTSNLTTVVRIELNPCLRRSTSCGACRRTARRKLTIGNGCCGPLRRCVRFSNGWTATR